MLKIDFKDYYVERLCKDREFAKKKLPQDAARGLSLLMPILIAAENLAFFMKPENLGYHLEKLKGKHQFELSLRLKKRNNTGCGYRMIFECTNTDIKDSYQNMNAIRILDINNHKY